MHFLGHLQMDDDAAKASHSRRRALAREERLAREALRAQGKLRPSIFKRIGMAIGHLFSGSKKSARDK